MTDYVSSFGKSFFYLNVDEDNNAEYPLCRADHLIGNQMSAFDGGAVSGMFEEHRLALREAEHPIYDRMGASRSDAVQDKTRLFISDNVFSFCENVYTDKRILESENGPSDTNAFVFNNYLMIYVPTTPKKHDNLIYPLQTVGEHILFFKGAEFYFSIFILQHMDDCLDLSQKNTIDSINIRSRRFQGKLSRIANLEDPRITVPRYSKSHQLKKNYPYWDFQMVDDMVYDIEYFRETVGFVCPKVSSTSTVVNRPQKKLKCSIQLANLLLAHLVQRHVFYPEDPNIGFWPVVATFHVQIKPSWNPTSKQIMVFRPSFEYDKKFVTLHEWRTTHSPQDVQIIQYRIRSFLAAVRNSNIELKLDLQTDKKIIHDLQDYYIFCSSTESNPENVAIWIQKLTSTQWSFKISPLDFEGIVSLSSSFYDWYGVQLADYIDRGDGYIHVKATPLPLLKPFTMNANDEDIHMISRSRKNTNPFLVFTDFSSGDGGTSSSISSTSGNSGNTGGNNSTNHSSAGNSPQPPSSIITFSSLSSSPSLEEENEGKEDDEFVVSGNQTEYQNVEQYIPSDHDVVVFDGPVIPNQRDEDEHVMMMVDDEWLPEANFQHYGYDTTRDVWVADDYERLVQAQREQEHQQQIYETIYGGDSSIFALQEQPLFYSDDANDVDDDVLDEERNIYNNYPEL